MLRKRYLGLGATNKHDRSKALDLLGFQSQLVFNTFGVGYILEQENGDDPDFAYGVALPDSSTRCGTWAPPRGKC